MTSRAIGRRATTAIAWVIAGASLAGCVFGPDAPGSEVARDPEAIENAVARSEAILAAHRERVSKLDRIHASGSVQVRFVGAESEWTEEQVGVKLWSVDRERTAARFQAGIDTDLLLFGSDGERTWFFDLWADPQTLCVWREGEPAPECVLQGIVPPFQRPLEMADLIFGDVQIPVDIADAIEVAPDGSTISVVADGRRRPIRLSFDVVSGALTTVEALDSDGAPVVRATLSEFRALNLDGYAELLAPRIATRVFVEDVDGTWSLRFGFDLESAPLLSDSRWRRWGRLFDLEFLQGRFEPGLVGGHLERSVAP